MKNLEMRGEWWVPSINEDKHYEIPEKEKQVVGELTYEPTQGGTLDLIGTLDFGSIDDNERGIIHGQTTDGRLVTLIDCFISGQSININDVSFETQKFHTSRVMVGDLVADSTKFWKMSFSTQSLEKWTNTPVQDSPGDLLPIGPGVVLGGVLEDIDFTLGMWEDTGSGPSIYPRSAYMSIWPDSPMEA